MRGAGALAGSAPELVTLALLVGAAALVVVVNELGGVDLLAAYRALSWAFLSLGVAYWLYVYRWRPARLDLWAVSLLFAVLFFSADGIIGLDPDVLTGPRVRLACQALLVVGVGLIGSWAGYQLVTRRHADVPGPSIWTRLTAAPLVVLLASAGAVWALRAYGATQGLVLAHGGIMKGAGAEVSLAIQLTHLARPLILFLGAVLLMDRHRPRRVVGFLIVAGELAYAALWSRRLLFEVILALLIVSLRTSRGLPLRRLALYGAVAAFAALVMWPFMFHLRTAANQAGLYRVDTVMRADVLFRDVVPGAFATFDLGAAFEPGSRFLDNVHRRSRFLDLLLDVMAAQGEGAPVMAGNALRAAAVATVPRAIWAGKEQLMATETWQVEELVQEHYGLPIVDMASTVLTHGYADGSVPGAVLYMALLGVLLGICERFGGRSRSSLLGLWVYGLGVSLAIQVEANVTDLFAVGRVIAVLLIVDRVAGSRLERWLAIARPHPGVGKQAWAT
jgi:hypothetical protein